MTCTDTPDSISPDPPARVLLVAGLRWTVSEAPARYDRRGTPDLLFRSDSLTLRVREYPPNWRALSDDELWDLAWRQHTDDPNP